MIVIIFMIAAGSIHGKFEQFINNLKGNDIKSENIIQCGNLGLGKNDELNRKQLEFLDRELDHLHCKMYAVRGNEDNPAYFTGEYTFANLKLVEDYKLLIIGGRKVFFLGGGITMYVEPEKYFREENIKIDEKKIAKAADADIIVTHVPPPYIFTFEYRINIESKIISEDACLRGKIDRQREALSRIKRVAALKYPPEYWFSGHYDVQGNTSVSGTNYIHLAAIEFFVV